MYGLDNTTGISVMPAIAPAVSPTPLWFTEGGANQSPSYPGQDWFNMMTAELLNVLNEAKINPNKGDLTQLTKAIKKIISDGSLLVANNLSEIKAAGPIAVAGTLLNLGLSDFANMTDVRQLIDAAFPVGVPLPYPLAAIPETVMGVVFFKLNGGTFSTTTYPKLALKYPTGVLPDMRGEFMRGWDDGRGVDSGRVILSAQVSTWIQPNLESTPLATTIMMSNTDGTINAGVVGGLAGVTGAGAGSRVAYYIRPRNLAFNYIVRAA